LVGVEKEKKHIHTNIRSFAVHLYEPQRRKVICKAEDKDAKEKKKKNLISSMSICFLMPDALYFHAYTLSKGFFFLELL